MKYIVVCNVDTPGTRQWQFSTLEAALKEAEKRSNDLNAVVIVAEVLGEYSRQTIYREAKRTTSDASPVRGEAP